MSNAHLNHHHQQLIVLTFCFVFLIIFKKDDRSKHCRIKGQYQVAELALLGLRLGQRLVQQLVQRLERLQLEQMREQQLEQMGQLIPQSLGA